MCFTIELFIEYALITNDHLCFGYILNSSPEFLFTGYVESMLKIETVLQKYQGSFRSFEPTFYFLRTLGFVSIPRANFLHPRHSATPTATSLLRTIHFTNANTMPATELLQHNRR